MISGGRRYLLGERRLRSEPCWSGVREVVGTYNSLWRAIWAAGWAESDLYSYRQMYVVDLVEGKIVWRGDRGGPWVVRLWVGGGRRGPVVASFKTEQKALRYVKRRLRADIEYVVCCEDLTDDWS